MILLEINNLKVHFPLRGGFFNIINDYSYAVDGIDMLIEKGKTYGLIGESGSGKTTIARAVVGLEEAKEGQIIYRGQELGLLGKKRNKGHMKEVQMIFQDSYTSLNPKKKAKDIIAVPLRNFKMLSKQEEHKEIIRLLDTVGLPVNSLYKYPYEFSGGERQRIGVARAIALNPKLIIADEPTSSLDLLVQGQILKLFQDIQKEFNLSYIFISHDLNVIRYMSDYLYIMKRGRFVEKGTRSDIFENPQHIYTRQLLASIPDIENKDKGKHFHERKKLEIEAEERKDIYYDGRGDVFDLHKLSETHFVAVKGGGS